MGEFRERKTGEVKSQEEWRLEFSNMSLPQVWGDSVCDALNIDPVLASPAATTSAYQTSVRDGVEQDSKGNWVEKYVAKDMFADTTDEDGKKTTKAEHEAAYQATLDASTANELADRVMQTPKREGYDGYLLGDGIAPNGESFGHGISFPQGQIEGDYFLRTDMLPNRLFRYDGRRWVKIEDAVRMDMTQSSTRNTQKTGFINNTATDTIGGETTEQRQSLSKALRPKADN